MVIYAAVEVALFGDSTTKVHSRPPTIAGMNGWIPWETRQSRGA